MSKKEKRLQQATRFLWYPIAWVIVVVYMTFESLWAAVSDWVFVYTPLQVFSERIHQRLEGQSSWLVLFVYLTHFLLMQGVAFLSGKMFLQGNVFLGVLLYIGKGLVTIPTVRFFVLEKQRLLVFWPIRIGYVVVVYIKSSKPYQHIAGWVLALKARVKKFAAQIFN